MLRTIEIVVAVLSRSRPDAARSKGQSLERRKDEVGNVSKRQAGCRMPQAMINAMSQFAVK